MSDESKIIDDDAMPSGSNEPAPDIEPTAEEIQLQQEAEDARKRAEILSQTSEGDNVFIKRRQLGAPAADRFYLTTITVDEWMQGGEEMIAKTFGAGHYFCQIKARNGRFIPGSTWQFKVDQAVKGTVDEENQKSEVVKAIEKLGTPKTEDSGLLKTLLEIQNAKGSDTMAMMMAMMKMSSEQNAQAQQSQAAMMSAMMTAMATMTGNKGGSELKELIAPLMAAALTPKKETSTREMIETFVQMKQLMGENPPHEDGLMATIGKALPAVAGMVAQGMMQPQPTQPPLPLPQQPTAPTPNMDMLENQFIVNRLLSLAEKKADAGFVCELLENFVPENQLDQVEGFLRLPNWFEIIVQQEPRFTPHQAWLTEVREEFLRVDPEPEIVPVPAPQPDVMPVGGKVKPKAKAAK